MSDEYYNGVKCDIYMGNKAGEELLKDIRSARKSVRVVSPYLSPELVLELVKIWNAGIHVELVTTDSKKNFYGKYVNIIYKLILQERRVNIGAQEKREKWEGINSTLTWAVCGAICLLVVLSQFSKLSELALIALFVVPMFLAIVYFRRRISAIAIYSYDYYQLFPFKVFVSKGMSERKGTDLHSKFYLIDNEIAYLGSLNFTLRGTKYNHETVVRTRDRGAIDQIRKEFESLLNSDLPERDVQAWGRQLYWNREPKN